MNINSNENAAQKSFLRAVIGIAVPVGLQSMLQSSFAMIDQLMVGRLGSTAVTAVEVAGRPAFIYSVVLGAVSAIAGIMISQYLGMKDEVMADHSLSVNLTAAMLLAVLFTVLCLLMPSQIVDLYIKDDPAGIVMDLLYGMLQKFVRPIDGMRPFQLPKRLIPHIVRTL